MLCGAFTTAPSMLHSGQFSVIQLLLVLDLVITSPFCCPCLWLNLMKPSSQQPLLEFREQEEVSAYTARTSTFIYSSLLVPRHVLSLAMMGMLGRGFICIGFFFWTRALSTNCLILLVWLGGNSSQKAGCVSWPLQTMSSAQSFHQGSIQDPFLQGYYLRSGPCPHLVAYQLSD